MNKIDVLKDLEQGFKNLQYNDENGLDRLSRRLKMLIIKLYGSHSDYLNDFYNIVFQTGFYSDEVPESVEREAWSLGTNQSVNLINTIIEEHSLFHPTKITTSKPNNNIKDNENVFIVHGHDNEAKTEVARFVERLGLEAIILHEQVSLGDTIIEKLEKYTDVGFAIVLYTPDDIGVVKSDANNPKPRARQNVVFEHGLLIGKIGRKNVVALVKDKVEIPNDISGVVYETMDSKGAWKYHLAREMKESDYDVDMNSI